MMHVGPAMWARFDSEWWTFCMYIQVIIIFSTDISNMSFNKKEEWYWDLPFEVSVCQQTTFSPQYLPVFPLLL